MTTTDERYAQELRARVDAVLPRVDVDVDGVVPRARRRRRVARGLGTTAVLVAVLGAGWAAADGLGPDRAAVAPALPDATAEPDVPLVGGVPAPAVVADDGTVTGVPGDPWDGDAPYWYMSVEMVAGADEPVEHLEAWISRERPGLLVLDGDLDHAAGIGPLDVIGELVLGGGRQPVSDPRALPTDPQELALALTGRLATGRDVDDGTFMQVRDVLHRGALLTRELRDAYWQVAARLPGTEADVGEDVRGRPGEVLRRTATDGEEVVLVRDAATGLLLEARSSAGWWAVYLEQRATDGTPVPPTLDRLGCRSWATCSR